MGRLGALGSTPPLLPSLLDLPERASSRKRLQDCPGSRVETLLSVTALVPTIRLPGSATPGGVSLCLSVSVVCFGVLLFSQFLFVSITVVLSVFPIWTYYSAVELEFSFSYYIDVYFLASPCRSPPKAPLACCFWPKVGGAR